MVGEADKDRLYVCLHARGGSVRERANPEEHYHWSLLVGPKTEEKSSQGTRFHAKNSTLDAQWVFEEQQVPLQPVNMLLVRLVVGKVRRRDRVKLAATLRKVPVLNNDPSFNCVAWVRNALEVLAEGKVARSANLDWNRIRQKALRYCLEKTVQHRFDGRGSFDLDRVATYDTLIGMETIS